VRSACTVCAGVADAAESAGVGGRGAGSVTGENYLFKQ
jgi:hypothetical protein